MTELQHQCRFQWKWTCSTLVKENFNMQFVDDLVFCLIHSSHLQTWSINSLTVNTIITLHNCCTIENLCLKSSTRNVSSLNAECCQLVFYSAHTCSVLAPCQVSHFEPAGINRIFITSNPFVIMVERQQVWEIHSSVSGDVINLKPISVTRLCFPSKYRPLQLMLAEFVHHQSFVPIFMAWIPRMLQLQDNYPLLSVALITILNLSNHSRTAVAH